jgi:hypothetical protein
MNPNYKIQIDVCLRKPVDADSVWVRRMLYLPFAPLEGQSIRLTSEDEEQTLDLVLESLVYDTHAGHFVVDITDDTLINSISESGSCDLSESLGQYIAFGFMRVNFPVAQAVRA